MFPFYAVSLLIVALTIVWWQQRDGARRFLAVLGGITLLWLIGMLIALLFPSYAAWWSVGSAAVIGAGLAWGARLSWRLAAAVGGGLLLLSLWPALPWEEMMRWGVLAAVPFTAVYLFASSRPHSAARSANDAAPSVPVKITYPVLARLEQGIVLQDESDDIQFVNGAAARLLDSKPEALLGPIVQSPLDELPLPSVDNGVSRFERNGRVMEIHRFVLAAEETAVSQVLVLNEITARYQAEQSRDQFLTTVSHELRSPLTVIKGYMELLCTGAAGELTSQQKNFAEQVQRQANHLVDLINSLIFVSSVQGGQLEYAGGVADLAQILRQMARELRPQATAQNVTIQVDVDKALTPIQADPIHMATVIKELLRNAIKYSHRGGKVAARAALQVEEEQSFAMLSVADQGIGIDPTQQANVFETFLRSDQSDTQVKAGGIGIGLPIVRALVEAYNGRVWFDSAPDQGATFFFLVPTEQPGVTVLPAPGAEK